MDAERFDAFARTLAGRLSRRATLRGAGAGAAGGLLAALGLRPSQAAPRLQDDSAPYVVIRTYQEVASIADLQQALGEGYAPLLAQQPGFLGYAVLDTEGGIASITAFASQAQEAAAADQVANWVQQNLANLLPSPDEVTSGSVFVQELNRAAICRETPAGPTPPPPTAAPPPPPTTVPPTALPVCTVPGEPGRGCPCQTGTENPCGVSTLLCCPTDPGVPGGPGICVPDRIGCNPTGPTPTPLPVCTDPARPGVGCPCITGTLDPCGPTTLLCCQNDPNGPPGGPGTCTPGSAGCQPLGPTPTPTPPPPPCTGRGCRCNGGVQNACDDPLVCCPDNPGLPGGPGRCLGQDVCNPPNCTGEGCACHSGVEGACDAGLICCADDPSVAGGPGRCETEDVCLGNQCQATTNPCPPSCAPGSYCQGCCSGFCGSDDHCGAPPCTGVGCECTAGVEGTCDQGLVCCQSQMGAGNVPGGPGQCAAEDACGGPPACTGIGCPCTAGVQGMCDDGLVCCQSQMNAPNEPGGPGQCAAADACGGSDVTPCTDVGCPCTAGVEGDCAPGLVCCQSQMTAPNEPGGPGMCATQDGCGGGDGSTTAAQEAPAASAPDDSSTGQADTPSDDTPAPDDTTGTDDASGTDDAPADDSSSDETVAPDAAPDTEPPADDGSTDGEETPEP